MMNMHKASKDAEEPYDDVDPKLFTPVLHALRAASVPTVRCLVAQQQQYSESANPSVSE
jgi:hypothetical protein